MRYSEKWGDSIDAAVRLALADLGLSEDEVKVTVLEEPSKGFFGIGSKLAKVRVEEKTAENCKKEEPVKAPKEEAKEIKGEGPEKSELRRERREALKEGNKENGREKRERRENREQKERRSFSHVRVSERPEGLTEASDHPAQKFLSDIAREMGLDISIKTYTAEKLVYIDVEGPDSGTVIGKRGSTLDALQYLTSLVVNKDDGVYTRVVINAEAYREKREKTLEKLANRIADKVIKTGKTARLEPMNPYERKIIHTALQARPEVYTKSEGEEPYRKVVVELAKK